MKRTTPALVITSLLLAACPGVGEDDSGDGSDESTMTGGISHASDPTTSGGDVGESTIDPSTGESDSGDESSSTTEIFCFADEILATPTIPRVMLVLDKSGSMIANPYGYWDHDADDADDDGFKDADPTMMATAKITRWHSLYETVEFIVGDFEERMDFGATLFPSIDATKDYNHNACVVADAPDVVVGPDQGATILATIPSADDTAIRGGTPAAAGMLTGLAGLAALPAVTAEKPPYVILVTDGAANCPIEPTDPNDASTLFEYYDGQLPVVVADALAQGIPTFVVGIDIQDEVSSSVKDGNPDATNTFEKLNEVAAAGGMARDGAEKFYNTANQVELQAALMEISVLITSCTLELSMPVKDGVYVKRLTVDPEGMKLQYDTDEVADCATESGWHFADDTHIELCGDACALYKETGKVDILFECPIG